MMKSSRFDQYKNIEENIIKYVRNLFRLKKLKKETNDTAIKGIKNLFRLKKENRAFENRIHRNIRNFEHEKGDYDKPVRVNKFWSNNKSKGDRKTLSVNKYCNKFRPYLKDIINNLKNILACGKLMMMKNI